MSRYRYLIERGVGENEVGLSTLEAGDDDGRGYSEIISFATIEEKVELAKKIASEDPAVPEAVSAGATRRRSGSPDAIAISGWLDDGVEENRDS